MSAETMRFKRVSNHRQLAAAVMLFLSGGMTFAQTAPPSSSAPLDAAARLATGAEAKRLAAREAAALDRDRELKAIALEKERELKAIELAKDQAIAAVEQKERDALDAKMKETEEKAFRASLSKLNAGELFVLADKRRSEGDTDKTREILRTLVTKFPANPLVSIAAQQLSQLPPPAPAVVAATAPNLPAPAPPVRRVRRDPGLEEMAAAFGAARK